MAVWPQELSSMNSCMQLACTICKVVQIETNMSQFISTTSNQERRTISINWTTLWPLTPNTMPEVSCTILGGDLQLMAQNQQFLQRYLILNFVDSKYLIFNFISWCILNQFLSLMSDLNTYFRTRIIFSFD